MSQRREDRLEQLAEQIRNQDYQVDPVAVADGLLRRVRWEDAPDIEPLLPMRWRQQILRLRSVLRIRRRASVTVRTRPQLSA